MVIIRLLLNFSKTLLCVLRQCRLRSFSRRLGCETGRSPVLYGVYVASLLIELSQSSVGCFVGNYFVGALSYADNIVLIAPKGNCDA